MRLLEQRASCQSISVNLKSKSVLNKKPNPLQIHVSIFPMFPTRGRSDIGRISLGYTDGALNYSTIITIKHQQWLPEL